MALTRLGVAGFPRREQTFLPKEEASIPEPILELQPYTLPMMFDLGIVDLTVLFDLSTYTLDFGADD